MDSQDVNGFLLVDGLRWINNSSETFEFPKFATARAPTTTARSNMLSAPDDCAEVMRQPIEEYLFNEPILDNFDNAWPAPHPDRTPQQLASLQENAERSPENRTNSSKLLPMSFRTGDIEAFIALFRRKLIELGRTNVAKILPAWIEEMRPSRKQYGPYGTKDMPPWWPREVPYKRSSRLEASALFTLAIEILLQHRRSEWYKRDQKWTTTLRSVTKSTTKPAKVILDSLFTVAQSYEKRVKEYSLLTYPNVSDAPMGGVVWSPPEEAVTDDQHESTRCGPESDSGTDELTIHNEWSQKMQGTLLASVVLNQQIHTELATEPSIPVDVDGNRNTITPQAQYRIMSEECTQSSDADILPFDNSSPYHIYYNANSFNQGQENTEGSDNNHDVQLFNEPAQTFAFNWNYSEDITGSLPGLGFRSNTGILTLEPYAGHIFTDGVFAMQDCSSHETVGGSNPISYVYYNTSVTLEDGHSPNAAFDHYSQYEQ